MNTMQTQIGQTMLKELMTLRGKGELQIEDVGALFEKMAANIQPSGGVETILKTEIQKMATDIMEAKKEIIAMLPAGEQNIAGASSQLSAVVKSTEDAANEILNTADEIQTLVGTHGPDRDAKLKELSAKLYEACSFQDLTTQRITKVIKLLEYTDGKVNKLVKLFSDGSESATVTLAEVMGDTRSDKALLNGPSDGAPSQADIDKMFGT